MMETDQLKLLGEAQRGASLITSAPNYEILSSPRYAELFYYDPIDHRQTMHASDMITRLLFAGEQGYKTNRNQKQ